MARYCNRFPFPGTKSVPILLAFPCCELFITMRYHYDDSDGSFRSISEFYFGALCFFKVIAFFLLFRWSRPFIFQVKFVLPMQNANQVIFCRSDRRARGTLTTINSTCFFVHLFLCTFFAFDVVRVFARMCARSLNEWTAQCQTDMNRIFCKKPRKCKKKSNKIWNELLFVYFCTWKVPVVVASIFFGINFSYFSSACWENQFWKVFLPVVSFIDGISLFAIQLECHVKVSWM